MTPLELGRPALGEGSQATRQSQPQRGTCHQALAWDSSKVKTEARQGAEGQGRGKEKGPAGLEPEHPRRFEEAGAHRSPCSRHGLRGQLSQNGEQPARLWGV